MGNSASSEGVANVSAMRVFGAILIVLSVAEFGVGGAVYGYMTNVHVGAWWAAICTFVAGVLGVVSSNRQVVVAGCVFSIIGVIIGIVGSIVDGIAAGILAYEKGCVNTDNGDLYGSGEGKLYAIECVIGTSFYNGYNNNFYYYDGLRNQCVCADKTVCYGYDLSTGDNCGLILTTYTKLLSASTAILSILTVATFIYSVFTCIGVCGTSAPPPAPVPTVQVQMQQQPVPIVYGSVPQQPPVVYAMAPVEEKAMLGVAP